MMNFAQYAVTVNASSNEVAIIRKAIEACGLYILNLTGVKAVGNGAYECSGCFIRQGGQRV
jgi:hypothetical protein